MYFQTQTKKSVWFMNYREVILFVCFEAKTPQDTANAILTWDGTGMLP